MAEARDGPTRRWRLVPLLLYVGAIALAALPPEVRPRLLDAPAAVATAGLGKLGLVGGIAVFEPKRERITRVLLADCIRVRGLRAGEPPRLLEPPDGECATEGLKPAIPRIEWMVRSLLLRAPLPLNQAIVGDRFCHPRDEPPFDTVEVLWTQPWRALYGEERGVANAGLFRWSCAPPALVYDSRDPGDEEVRREWGAP